MADAAPTAASRRRRQGAAIALSLAALPLVQGCLPGDTRPPPATLYATVEPSQAVAEGFDTSDGFHITFERLVAGVGNVDFEDDDADCNVYAEAHYDRLYDFTIAGREKVGTAYGLGTCRVRFRLRSPSADAVLGSGATADDVTFMRTRATDAFADDERASVVAIGSAARGDETKRFHWVFRRSYQIAQCKAEGGGLATTLDLAGGTGYEIRLELRGEELFRSLADDNAPLWFEPIAHADADGDGEVTLDELGVVPRPPLEGGGLSPGDGAGAPAAPSLEQLVYDELLPRLLRMAGAGACEAEERSRR